MVRDGVNLARRFSRPDYHDAFTDEEKLKHAIFVNFIGREILPTIRGAAVMAVDIREMGGKVTLNMDKYPEKVRLLIRGELRRAEELKKIERERTVKRLKC